MRRVTLFIISTAVRYYTSFDNDRFTSIIVDFTVTTHQISSDVPFSVQKKKKIYLNQLFFFILTLNSSEFDENRH